jgi:dTDP-4-amino-4,6-dideoxygalactose transaminase
MQYRHLIAWNYRFQEMPAAFARSQLKRLPQYNAQARANGEALTARLQGVKGVEPPFVPDYCEAIYHKYRLRLHPEALDVPMRGMAFRNVVLKALEAEGVDVYTWLEHPLPANPIFQVRSGYGGGYPWTIAHKDLRYRAEDYPRTQALLDNSLCICSELIPIYCQPASLIDQYADAIIKVISDREGLMKAAERIGGRA